MPLWLVLTRFGFVEVFLSRPTWKEGHWSGRCIYPFDPLTVWALGFRRWLVLDVPRRMIVTTQADRQPWRLDIKSAGELIIRRRIVGDWLTWPVIHFCDRMIRALRLDDVPIGGSVWAGFD